LIFGKKVTVCNRTEKKFVPKSTQMIASFICLS